MTKLDELYNRAKALKAELEDVQNEIAWEHSQYRAEVSFTKKNDTYIMSHNGRTIKAKPCRSYAYNRYRIWEGRRVIARESLSSISQIRLDFALGRI